MLKKLGSLVLALVLTLSVMLVASCKPKVTLSADPEVEAYIGDEVNFNVKVDSKKVSAEEVLSNLEYTSSVENIVKIENDKVIACNLGTTEITITWKENKDVSVKVSLTVKERPLEVEFNKVPTVLGIGDSFTFEAKTEGVEVTYTVDNDAVATIDGAKLTTKAAGKIKVTATCKKGEATKVYEFQIEVKDTFINVTYFDGGTHENPEKVDTRELPINLKPATKQGYKFLGWYLEDSFKTKVDSIAKGTTKDLTLYAKWEKSAVVSDIIYKLYGGELPEGAITTYEEGTATTLPIPTRDGYVFLGWSKIKHGIKYVTEVPEDAHGTYTVHANWARPSWNIEYVLNGGELPEGAESKYTEGTGLVLPVPTKDKFVFVGWSLTEDGTDFITEIGKDATGDKKVYAIWEEAPTKVVITPEFNGGSFAWQAGKPASPKDGIDADSDLPEIFTADFYRYLNETGLINSSIIASGIKKRGQSWADFSKLEGDPMALYNETSTMGYGAHDGYNQFFWDTLDGEVAVGGFLGTSPYKEKYANLTSMLVKMTNFKYSGLDNESFKAGAGFVLDGYFYGTQGLVDETEPGGKEFNALRSFIPTPTKGHDGTKEYTTVYEVLEGELNTTITLVEPSMAGHIFMGWYLNPELKGEPVTSVNESCRIYAKWQDLTKPMPEHEITYVLNGGELESPVVSYNEWSVVKFPIPTKSKNRFVGWTLTEGGTDFVKATETSWKQDITLYANWVEDNSYKITYKYEIGQLPTHEAKDLAEFWDYFFKSFYAWSGSDEDFEAFKTRHINTWSSGDQTEFKLYRGDSKDQIIEGYFVHCKENFDEWMPFLNALDEAITIINPAQSAWGSPWVGHLRLGALIKGTASYIKPESNEVIRKSVPIPTPLPTGYKAGDAFDLVPLVIDDGRTFLGWFDEEGNKVDKITADMKEDLILTARWSESTPIEGFDITNKPEKMLRFSETQLTWTFTPVNTTNKGLKFSSSNPGVLEVTPEGLLIAHTEGTADITVEVLADSKLNLTFTVEVYVEDFIDGSYETDTYVEPENNIKLVASVHSKNPGKILWRSKNPDIATVDEDGLVTGVKPGFATIEAYVEGHEEVNLTFGVTIISLEESDFFGIITKAHNPEIFVNHNLNVAYTYLTDVIGSANDLLFNYNYEVHKDHIIPTTHENRPGTKIDNMEFITVHYTAGTPKSSNGENTAIYFNGTNAASANYCVGNDGIWECIPAGEVAWHAGDGTHTKFEWIKTGVKAPNGLVKPKITCVKDSKVSSGWVFAVNGQKTDIAVPTTGSHANGTPAKMEDPNNNFTFYGPSWTVKDGEYCIGTTWACFSQVWEGAVSSRGGNLNSVGIETACNIGSDLWYTYQITAQLVAHLLHQYGLDTTRVTGHNNFSGKDCPQTLLANNGYLWYKFMECVEAEYALEGKMQDYEITCKSNNPEILSDNGRILKQPNYTQNVSYTVTVKNVKTGVTKQATYSSIIHGLYTE